jgi:hypothetical protein
MFSHHEIPALDAVLRAFALGCAEAGLLPLVRVHPTSLCLEIVAKKLRAIVYRYRGHGNPDFVNIDMLIDENNLIEVWSFGKSFHDNQYTCADCRRSKDVMVFFTFTDVETFCAHSSFIDDEIKCFF